jgi:hypothetical protein
MALRVLVALFTTSFASTSAEEVHQNVSPVQPRATVCIKKPSESQLKDLRNILDAAEKKQGCAFGENQTALCRDGKLIVRDLATGKETVQAVTVEQDPDVVETLFVGPPKNGADNKVAYQLNKDGTVDRVNLTTGQKESRDLGALGKNFAEQAKLGKFKGDRDTLTIPGISGSEKPSQANIHLDSLFQDFTKKKNPDPLSGIPNFTPRSNPNGVPIIPTRDSIQNNDREPLLEIPCSSTISEKEKQDLKSRGVRCSASTTNQSTSSFFGSTKNFFGSASSAASYLGRASRAVGGFVRSILPAGVSSDLFHDFDANTKINTPSERMEVDQPNSAPSGTLLSTRNQTDKLALGNPTSGIASGTERGLNEIFKDASNVGREGSSEKNDLDAMASSLVAQTSFLNLADSSSAIHSEMDVSLDATLPKVTFSGVQSKENSVREIVVDDFNIQSQKTKPASRAAQKNSDSTEKKGELPSDLKQTLAILSRRRKTPTSES